MSTECNSGSFHDLDVFIENHKEKIIKLMAQKYSITNTTWDFQYTCSYATAYHSKFNREKCIQGNLDKALTIAVN